MTEAIGCPQCGVNQLFETIEHVVAYSPVLRLTSGPDGTINVEWEGSTVDSDARETVGLRCVGCGWEHEGAPSTWPDALFPKPDVAAMIATRERMRHPGNQETP